MVHALAQLAVMVEQVRPALKLHNRVMRRPAQHGLEDPAAVRERAQGAVTDAVGEEVRVARRVREVVLAAPLVHPRGLEEAAVVVVALDGLARLRRQDGDLLHGAVELVHVVCELGHAGALGRDALARALLGALPRGVKGLGVAVLVALQLAAPETAKVQIRVAVVVDERGRVDAEGSLDGLRIRDKGALGLVTLGHADAEDALLVAGGEVQVVFPVLRGGVRGPELLAHPRDVLGPEDDAVVRHLARRGVQAGRGEDVVVGHVVLVAIVVELDVGLAVVGGVDVDAVVEDVGGGVCGEDVGDEGRHLGQVMIEV